MYRSEMFIILTDIALNNWPLLTLLCSFLTDKNIRVSVLTKNKEFSWLNWILNTDIVLCDVLLQNELNNTRQSWDKTQTMFPQTHKAPLSQTCVGVKQPAELWMDSVDSQRLFRTTNAQKTPGVFEVSSSSFSYHVGGKDQNSFMFPTRPLGVTEEVGVIVHHIIHTWTTESNRMKDELTLCWKFKQ